MPIYCSLSHVISGGNQDDVALEIEQATPRRRSEPIRRVCLLGMSRAFLLTLKHSAVSRDELHKALHIFGTPRPD